MTRCNDLFCVCSAKKSLQTKQLLLESTPRFSHHPTMPTYKKPSSPTAAREDARPPDDETRLAHQDREGERSREPRFRNVFIASALPHPTCLVCSRPVPSPALTCAYCGEDLPHRSRRVMIYATLSCTALAAVTALTVVRGVPPLPAKLTLPASLLLALGIGLVLRPPALHGVAGHTRQERLWQIVPRVGGGLVQTLLTALTALAILTPKPWTILDATLASASVLILLAAPRVLKLPWRNLLAGILLAAGWLLAQ